MKVALAARLWAETTMTVKWIAERLAMGTRGDPNRLLYRLRRWGALYTLSRTDPQGPSVPLSFEHGPCSETQVW